MPIKVLVINEPFVKGFCRTQRWAARTRGRVLRAPDWLAYCTAVLGKQGFDVELYDFVVNNWDKQKLRKLIKDRSPDFVVMDSTTPSIYSDIECARICKEESNTKVIMVGPHISALPRETLEIAKDAVDVAAIGEYDYTLRDIINKFDNLEGVKGIAYWKDNEVRLNKQRQLIQNLDDLPFPAWHHLDLMKYFDGGKLYPYIDIISGRGCPNRCIFCLWPQVMHGTRYRLRSPKNVVDEIEYDIKLCPKVLRGGEFFFEDDTFTADKERAIIICEEILKRNLKITFSVNARADSYDLEMFKMMKKAGCRELLVGFESADQRILDNVNKNIKVKQMQEFMKMTKKTNLEVHGCFVFGLPGETKETIQKTTDFALLLGLNTVQFSSAVPFPGTDYYEICKEKGWLKSNDWRDWLREGEQAAVIKYENLSSKEIDQYVDLALKRFYLRPKYILCFISKNRTFSDFYRKTKGGINFILYLFNTFAKKIIAFFKKINKKLTYYSCKNIQLRCWNRHLKYIKKDYFKEKDVLDVGCASGSFSKSSFFSDSNMIVGIDILFPCIHAALYDKNSPRSFKYRVENKNSRNSFFLVSDGENMPFLIKTFNAVSCIHTFHHFINKGAFISETKRVLKSEGILIIVDPNGSFFMRSLCDYIGRVFRVMNDTEKSVSLFYLKQLLIRNGFEIVQTKYFHILSPIFHHFLNIIYSNFKLKFLAIVLLPFGILLNAFEDFTEKAFLDKVPFLAYTYLIVAKKVVNND